MKTKMKGKMPKKVKKSMKRDLVNQCQNSREFDKVPLLDLVKVKKEVEDKKVVREALCKNKTYASVNHSTKIACELYKEPLWPAVKEVKHMGRPECIQDPGDTWMTSGPEMSASALTWEGVATMWSCCEQRCADGVITPKFDKAPMLLGPTWCKSGDPMLYHIKRYNRQFDSEPAQTKLSHQRCSLKMPSKLAKNCGSKGVLALGSSCKPQPLTLPANLPQDCQDYVNYVRRCGYWAQLFKSLQNPVNHLFPCLATSYMSTHKFLRFYQMPDMPGEARECSAMMLSNDQMNGDGSVSGKFKGLIDLMRKVYKSAKTQSKYAFILNYNLCTVKFPLMMGFLVAFKAFLSFAQYLPVIGGPIKIIKKVLSVFMLAMTIVWSKLQWIIELQHKFLQPVLSMAARMGDIANFFELMFAYSSAANQAKMVDLLAKPTETIGDILKVLEWGERKIASQEAIIDGVWHKRLTFCNNMMTLFLKHPIVKFMQKALDKWNKLMNKKIKTPFGSFSVQDILDVINDLMASIVNMVMRLLKPIIDKLKKKILKMLKPLLAKMGLEFPAKPKDPFPDIKWAVPLEPPCDGGTDPIKNVGKMYTTCANNNKYVMKSGANMCHCCFLGTLELKPGDFAHPIANQMVLKLREGLCPILTAGTSEKPDAPPKGEQSKMCKEMKSKTAAKKAKEAKAKERRRRTIKIPSIGKLVSSLRI